MNTNSTPTKKAAGFGGTKGERIQALLVKHPDWTRAKIAEAAEATVQRVGEVIRALVKDDVHPKPGPAKKAAKSTNVAKSKFERVSAPVVQETEAKVDEVTTKRNDKANHDAIMAGEAGNFDAAVDYARRTKRRVPKRG